MKAKKTRSTKSKTTTAGKVKGQAGASKRSTTQGSVSAGRSGATQGSASAGRSSATQGSASAIQSSGASKRVGIHDISASDLDTSVDDLDSSRDDLDSSPVDLDTRYEICKIQIDCELNFFLLSSITEPEFFPLIN